MTTLEAQKEFATRFHCWANRLHPAWTNTPPGLLSDDERSLLQQRRSLHDDLLQRRLDIHNRKKAGERVRLASKRTLQKASTDAFRGAFGDQLKSSRIVETGDRASFFETECCGWKVSTNFWFGRQEPLISYNHFISSPTPIANHDHPAAAAPLSLALGLSLVGWRGSPSEFELLTEQTIEPACDAVMLMCRLFFKEAPKMLKGMEFERMEFP